MAETAEISEFATLLRPGDTVVLYTGVSEARQRGSFFGEAGVAEVTGASLIRR